MHRSTHAIWYDSTNSQARVEITVVSGLLTNWHSWPKTMSGTKVSAFALKGIFTIGTCWWDYVINMRTASTWIKYKKWFTKHVRMYTSRDSKHHAHFRCYIYIHTIHMVTIIHTKIHIFFGWQTSSSGTTEMVICVLVVLNSN